MPTVFQTERFEVSLQNSDTLEYADVVVEVGIEGMKIYDARGGRTMRIYQMKDISRWSLSHDTLTIYVKTKIDVEERQVQFRGTVTTIQSLLDSLTCASHQMYEVLESQEAEAKNAASAGHFASSSAGAGASAGKRKQKNVDPRVEEIAFWMDPEKQGWMFSQGEVIKTWRKRWFVLKSGFVFRFYSNDIDSTSKPRGVVDLSAITDITNGKSTTGKDNSIKLSTASGFVCYYTESEMDMGEWISALDTAHAKIVKRLAGVEEEEDRSFSKSRTKIRSAEQFIKKNFDFTNDRSTDDMVSVVGYDAFTSATAPPDTSSLTHTSLNYGDIDGISGAVSHSRNDAGMVHVNYQDYGRQGVNIPQQSTGGGNEYQPTSMYSTATPAPTYNQYYPHAGAGMGPTAPQYAPSFLDQTPQQTPTYPSFQTVSAPTSYRIPVPNTMTPASNSSNPMHTWQVIQTPDGRVYYHNRATGKTQWERPAEIVL